MIEKDKLHYSNRYIDSYNATWNFVMSEREAGKTTAWANSSYKLWKEKQRTTIVLRYLIADITDTYISDLQTVINDFLPDDKQIKFSFKKGSVKEGIVDVFVKDYEEIPLFRFIALSNPISRIKSMKLKAAGRIIFDEFILNTRCGERYPEGLVTRFKELYNTYLRCAKGWKFKLYCYGNVYSRFHPLLSDLGVDFSKMKQGAFIYDKDKDYCVWCYKLKPELKELILKKNPLYKFDNAYTRYAFDAQAINDNNFEIVEKLPQNYSLKFIFRIDNKYLGIYQFNGTRSTIGYDTGRYWISIIEYTGNNRKVYAVDFNNLISGTQLISSDIKSITFRLKLSIANRDVTYNSIEAGYLTEDIYSYIA